MPIDVDISTLGSVIKTAYEGEADTNAFTDAEQTKLAGVETGATADQTGAEIKSAYEGEADTNAFDDAAQSKLSGIESNATADQTGAQIKTAYEGEADTNAFTDADHSKLDGIEASATADQTDLEIETAYNNRVDVIAQLEAETGTETIPRRWTAERVAQAIAALGGSGSGGLTPVFKTANYTAVDGEFVFVDTTGGAVTITLPASPSDQNRVKIVDAGGNAGQQNITVARNSETINGDAEDFIIDQNFGAGDFSYDGTGTDWKHQLIGYPDLANVDDYVIGARRITIRPEVELMGKSTHSVPFSWSTLNASGVPVEIRTADFTNNGSNNEYAQWSWIIPPSCDPSQPFRIRVVWAPSSTNTGDITFNVRQSHVSDEEDMPTSSFQKGLFLNEVPAGTADRIQITPWESTTISGLAVGDYLNLQFYRIGSDVADTFTGTVHVLAIEIEYQEQATNDDE